ncbi:hypothetical protein D3C72_1002180 [compost metagenome]
MARPALQFANNLQAILGTIRLRWIARKFLIRQVRVIFKSTGRFYDIDLPLTISLCQFGTPGGRI